MYSKQLNFHKQEEFSLINALKKQKRYGTNLHTNFNESNLNLITTDTSFYSPSAFLSPRTSSRFSPRRSRN